MSGSMSGISARSHWTKSYRGGIARSRDCEPEAEQAVFATTPTPLNREGSVQLSRDELLEAYRDMVTIRRFEERVQEEFSKGGIPGFVHLYAGEEAAAVGGCSHLGPQDYIASTHRGHGHSIAKGCDPVSMMQELCEKEGGRCGGKGAWGHTAERDRGRRGRTGLGGGGPPLVIGAALTAKTL